MNIDEIAARISASLKTIEMRIIYNIELAKTLNETAVENYLQFYFIHALGIDESLYNFIINNNPNFEAMHNNSMNKSLMQECIDNDIELLQGIKTQFVKTLDAIANKDENLIYFLVDLTSDILHRKYNALNSFDDSILAEPWLKSIKMTHKERFKRTKELADASYSFREVEAYKAMLDSFPTTPWLEELKNETTVEFHGSNPELHQDYHYKLRLNTWKSWIERNRKKLLDSDVNDSVCTEQFAKIEALINKASKQFLSSVQVISLFKLRYELRPRIAELCNQQIQIKEEVKLALIKEQEALSLANLAINPPQTLPVEVKLDPPIQPILEKTESNAAQALKPQVQSAHQELTHTSLNSILSKNNMETLEKIRQFVATRDKQYSVHFSDIENLIFGLGGKLIKTKTSGSHRRYSLTNFEFRTINYSSQTEPNTQDSSITLVSPHGKKRNEPLQVFAAKMVLEALKKAGIIEETLAPTVSIFPPSSPIATPTKNSKTASTRASA